MKRTINVLLTLAVCASVVSLAYYLSEILAIATGNTLRSPYGDYNEHERATNYAKFITYWLMGFGGMFVVGRVIKSRSFTGNALMIAFGYLLILGSHGGLTFAGSYYLKAVLSLMNTIIFTFTYVKFEQGHYGAAPSAPPAMPSSDGPGAP